MPSLDCICWPTPLACASSATSSRASACGLPQCKLSSRGRRALRLEEASSARLRRTLDIALSGQASLARRPGPRGRALRRRGRRCEACETVEAALSKPSSRGNSLCDDERDVWRRCTSAAPLRPPCAPSPEPPPRRSLLDELEASSASCERAGRVRLARLARGADGRGRGGGSSVHVVG